MTVALTSGIVLLLVPLIVLRRAALVRCFAGYALLAGASFVAFRQIGPAEGYFLAAALVVATLALFALVLSTAPSAEVRWSATRASAVALLVYLALIPVMLRTPIDGDEPYYLLITESIVHDRDADLANQYRTLAQSASGRTDLRPQVGDRTTSEGAEYSRLEPLLPLLLVPGFLIGGLPGALVMIALFGGLLVRSTMRMFEDEGVSEATARAVFPFFAFGAPVLFYAARIWPEVPAAFLFVEAVRGVRNHRTQRWLPALVALTLLKLRFILVAIPMLVKLSTRRRRNLMIVAAVVVVPLLVLAIVSGSATSMHRWQELLPSQPDRYVKGLVGLLIDGAAGMLLQAPFYLLGIFAMARWSRMPGAFRTGCVAASLYVLYLVPRAEWHGGWSPPLRYIVFLTPVLALGAAAIWDRIPKEAIAVLAVWTVGIAAHGVAYPWRLFQVANGENAIGEALSRLWQSDFSRLFPSLIRPNLAAIVAGAVLALALFFFALVRRERITSFAPLLVPALTALLAAGFLAGRSAGAVVHFEDAHVAHDGGELYPQEYTVARFLYQGGWMVKEGDTMSFQARKGVSRLYYASPVPSLIEIGGRAYQLAPTPYAQYGTVHVNLPHSGRTRLRCVSGIVNLDRMESLR